MRYLLLSLMLAMPAFAAEPTAGIRLPVLEFVAPTPGPAPQPSAVTKLSSNQLYIIDSDVELAVVASRDGLVQITAETGPLKIRGVFVDNLKGKPETRSFKGPFIYTIDVVATGEIELVIFKDVKTPAIRRTLNVYDTDAPPVVPTPTDSFAESVASAYKAETATDKFASVGKLASLYRMAATTTTKDASVKTYGDLFSDMESSSRSLGVPPPPALAGIRKVIGGRLGKSLEPASGPIDRDLAAKEFKAIADALAACK